MSVSQDGGLRREHSAWRSSGVAAAELSLAVLIAVGNTVGIVPFSSTPFLLILGWFSLRRRGVRWRQIGFAWPGDWPRVVMLGVATGVAYQYASLYAVEPLIARLTGRLPDASVFASLPGNVPMLAITLSIIWTLAAFGEELVFRGYLMSRIADLAGGQQGAWVLSAVVTSAFFGLVHAYQGTSGVIDNGLTGLVFAGLYLVTGRNLVAAIVAHGTFDTVGAVLLFLHKYPGL